MLSAFALMSAFSFASNGEKEITKLDLINESIESTVTDESQDFFITHKKYRIEVWFYISSGGYATSYGKTVIPESECLDDTNVEILRASMESAYQAMNPGSTIGAKAIYLEDC